MRVIYVGKGADLDAFFIFSSTFYSDVVYVCRIIVRVGFSLFGDKEQVAGFVSPQIVIPPRGDPVKAFKMVGVNWFCFFSMNRRTYYATNSETPSLGVGKLGEGEGIEVVPPWLHSVEPGTCAG